MATQGNAEEMNNYIRAILLMRGIATEAVRIYVFDRIPIFAPSALAGTLAGIRNSTERKFHHLQKILFPATGNHLLTSSEYDLTMMVALVNIFFPPQPDDDASWTIKQKRVKVIKDNRNTLGHIKDCSMNNMDFTALWNAVKCEILELVDDDASKADYQKKMQGIRDMPIGNDEYLKAIAFLRTLLQDLQDDVSDIKDTQQTIIDNIKRIETGMKKDIQANQTEIMNLKSCQTKMQSAVEGVQAGQAELQSTVEGIQADHKELKSTLQEKMIPHQALTREELGSKLQQHLKDYYKKNRAHVPCNPLNPQSTMPVREIYIETELQGLPLPDGEIPIFDHYKKIFVKNEKPINKILVVGKSGGGKTTFSIVLVQDWANNKGLERFAAVFLLTMRNVKPTQSLVDIIKEQLLRRQPELVDGLQDYIESNSDKCLFVLDGLDELGKERSQEIDDILNGFYLDKACFLITSRPWLVQDLVLTDHSIDQHVIIEGFQKTNVPRFITKLFAYMFHENSDSKNVRDKSSKLFVEVENMKCFDLMKIPLILQMTCLLFYYDHNLPNTMYKLYKKFRELLYEKDTEKSKQNNDDLHEILMKLGKFAFEKLLKENDQLCFDYDEVIALVEERAFKIGFISCERLKGKMQNDTLVSFMHKTIQENLAAYYVGQETEKKNEQPWEELKKEISTVERLRNKALLLEFMAGESLSLYESIRSFLDKMLLEALRNGYGREYGNDDVTHILQLQSNCLKNMQGTLQPKHISDHIRCDDELESFATSSKSLSWVYLQGICKSDPFCFTEKTVSLLYKILKDNLSPCSVYIGGNCKMPFKLTKDILNILKEHRNINFTYITFGSYPRYINRYKNFEWLKLFEVLSGFQKLLGIGLYECDIPATVLPTLGAVINANANTLFVLNLAGNHRIKGNFDIIATYVTTQDPLVLSWLNLSSCLSPSDTESASEFLLKAKRMRHLFIRGCECEISQSVLGLVELRFLWIADTVSRRPKRGLDVKKLFQNLHAFQHLENLYAACCEIDDSDLENVQVEKLSRIRSIEIDGNNITSGAAIKFQQKFPKKGIVRWE